MGRPPKKGIDFSRWDVDLFDNDTKIDALLDAQGWTGFGVYFYLCQRAYGSEGYFYPWSYSDAATTARKMGGGVGSETVKQTVSLCLRIGLFDKGLFDREGILTSVGIQRRFVDVGAKRTSPTAIKEYWLLDPSESDGFSFRTLKKSFDRPKLDYDRPKPSFETTKERRGEESRAEDRIGKVPPEGDESTLPSDAVEVHVLSPAEEIVGYLNSVVGTDFRANTKETKSNIQARIKEGFKIQDFKTVIDKKTLEWKNNPKMRMYLRPNTLFCKKNFENYLHGLAPAPVTSGEQGASDFFDIAGRMRDDETI